MKIEKINKIYKEFIKPLNKVFLFLILIFVFSTILNYLIFNEGFYCIANNTNIIDCPGVIFVYNSSVTNVFTLFSSNFIHSGAAHLNNNIIGFLIVSILISLILILYNISINISNKVPVLISILSASYLIPIFGRILGRYIWMLYKPEYLTMSLGFSTIVMSYMGLFSGLCIFVPLLSHSNKIKFTKRKRYLITLLFLIAIGLILSQYIISIAFFDWITHTISFLIGFSLSILFLKLIQKDVEHYCQ